MARATSLGKGGLDAAGRRRAQPFSAAEVRGSTWRTGAPRQGRAQSRAHGRAAASERAMPAA
eukprot:6330702-Lingulodinium_polyedra.AAC.1